MIWFLVQTLTGQKYFSKEGHVHFISEAPLEKIEASNHNAMIVMDASTGQVEWSVLIKGFRFEKSLMQEHFNENYMESHKYPKGLFKGTILDIKEVDFHKEGVYAAHATGDLTLHGVTQPITVSGQIIVKAGKITAQSAFDIQVADYNIKIPKVVRDNIAKTVKVNVRADLQKMK